MLSAAFCETVPPPCFGAFHQYVMVPGGPTRRRHNSNTGAFPGGVQEVRRDDHSIDVVRIASVDRLATPIAVISVLRSLSASCGRVEEIAIAAEMPQMPVAPPEISPSTGETFSRRAISTPKPMVSTTAPTSPTMPHD